MSRITPLFLIPALLICTTLTTAHANELKLVEGVPIQPLKVHIERLITALDYLGNPITNQDKQKLQALTNEKDHAKAVHDLQQILDPYCLVGVNINPESRVKVDPGPAKRDLQHKGWRQFLVKVSNHAGVTAELKPFSEQAHPIPGTPKNKVDDRWMQMQMFNGRPLSKNLSGVKLEYRIIQIYSRDPGQRAAVLSFNVGQGTQDIGFRNDTTLTFNCIPSTKVTLRVKDHDGSPTMAGFEIRDHLNRTYPSQAKRIEPDFYFHPQVYREDGEFVHLPPGKYNIVVQRGPEYYKQVHNVTIPDKPIELTFNLKRWIDPMKMGWWSGDHHIHAAGCMHYTRPSEGVHPPAMMRHVKGEDLKVGSSLNWGPSFDYQKQFFTGKPDKASKHPHIIRQDIEVSGFGSHQSGHLCLLRLREQIYPGGDSKHHWPTLGLNTLKWAQKQGAVCGPAHSGWGLAVPGMNLPNYNIPPFNGIGANEYIVDVTHMVDGPNNTKVPAVDFISMCDTPYTWEMNIWYHTLNVGYRTRISGETDFPCIYGERVGLGRSYVELDDKLDYDEWCAGIEKGRAYVGDGRSHLINFKVNNLKLGHNNSQINLAKPGKVKLTAQVGAFLPEKPDPTLPNYARAGKNGVTQPWAPELKPFWHLERARINNSRDVLLEVIVNGYPVAEKKLKADGTLNDIQFEIPIEKSSWVALRILGSSHTNPIWVIVDDKPVRASKKSAEWCLKSVEQCWKQKKRFYKPNEMDDAVKAYDHARKTYKQIISESE